MDLRDMRKAYRGVGVGFEEDTLVSKEPFQNFHHWLNDALNSKAIHEANAVSLATATKDGKPSVRIVLLKGFDKNGFIFFTNYESRKGQEIDTNPQAAMTFYWTNMESEEPIKYSRQVRIEGSVEKMPEEKSEEYFKLRPRDSQISAIISPQSKPITSMQFLIDRAAEVSAGNPDESKSLQRPANWGGYVLRPDVVEFWQGDTSRRHDRIVFRRPKPDETLDPEITKKGEDGWIYERLAP